MMRAVTGVTLFCLLAGLGTSFRPIVYQPGSVLRYKYEGALFAGLPELADQYSGFEIKADLILYPTSQNRVALKIENVLLGKINDELPISYEEDVHFQHTFSQEYQRELSKPIIFYHEKGVVEKFESDASDKEWSVNIKKSILTLFSVDLTKSNSPSSPVANYVPQNNQDSSFYSVYEDGIGGECETWYNVLSVPSLDHPDTSSDVLNVTKTKNYKNCLHRPTYEWNNHGVQGCPGSCFSHKTGYSASISDRLSPYKTNYPYGFEPDHHPVKSYSFTEYNISSASHSPVIEDISQEGKTSYILNGDEFIVAVRQNVTLLRTAHATYTIPTISQPVVHESLSYSLPTGNFRHGLELPYFSIYGPINHKEILDTLRLKLESVADDIIPDEPETSQTAGSKIIELTNAFSVLKRDQFETLYSELESDQSSRVPRKQAIMRKIFLDILGIVPTNEAAHYAAKLIESGRVSTFEALELVEAISHNIAYPDEELLEHLWQLFQTPAIETERFLFTSTVITFGKLVRKACINPKFNHHHEYKPPAVGNDNLNSYQYTENLRRSARDISEYGQERPHYVKDEHNDAPYISMCGSGKAKEYIEGLVHRMEVAKEVHEIVAYIEALTHTASHLALRHLEPYLSGEAKIFDILPDDDDEFVRVTAIYALKHIGLYHSREVLKFVVPVYFDQSEAYHVRIAAAKIIFYSKPPIGLLEKIATKLWDETNNQVGSYVYSMFQGLGNLTDPCFRETAQMIQAVFSHAKPFDIGFQHSRQHRRDYYDDENDYGYSYTSAWVSHNESFIPRGTYIGLKHITGPFRSNLLELGYHAKGVDTLLKKLMERGGILSQVLSDMGSNVQTTNVHNVLSMIKEKLGTTPDEEDEMRATVYYKLFGRSSVLSLDEAFILRIVEDVVNWFKTVDTTGGISSQYVKVWMPESFFKVVPSALGVPVVINHRQPIIFSLIIENARFAASGTKKASPMNGAFALSAVIRPSLHYSSIVMAYGVSPAERILYGVGNEKVYEVSVPMEVNLALDYQKDTIAFSLKPKLPHEIFYHQNRPLTFQAKSVLIDVPKPEWLHSVNEIQTIPEPFKFEDTFVSKALGFGFRIKAETETIWSNIPFWLSETSYQEGIVPAFLEAFHNLGLKPREFHVYAEAYPKDPASEFIVTVKCDKTFSKTHLPTDRIVDTDSDDYNEVYDENDIFHEYSEVISKIYGAKHQLASVEETIGELMKKTHADWSPVISPDLSEPVPATVAHLLYVTSVIKGSHSKHLAWKLMYAHTLDHRNIYYKVEGHKSVSEGYSGKPWKFCFDAAFEYPEIPNEFYLELNSILSGKGKLRAELGWGQECNGDNEIIVLGVMEKSPEQVGGAGDVFYSSPSGQKALPWFYKQCQVDHSEGLTQSFACELAINDMSNLNHLTLDFVAKNLSPYFLNYTYKFELAAKSYFYPNMEVNPLVSNPSDRVRVVVDSVDQVPEIPLTNVYIYKPKENIFFKKLYTPYYRPMSALQSMDEAIMDEYMNYDYIPECNLMEDYLNTFDNVTVQIADNNCQYLLAQGGIYDNTYAVLYSQVDPSTKTKVLVVSAAGRTFKLTPPHGVEVPIEIDSQSHVITPKNPIILDFDKEHETYVYVQQTPSSTDTPILVLEFPEEGLIVKYDGKNAKIQISHWYKGNQEGLCGNFNGEYRYEFTGPDDCIYVNEEDFVDSYAIPGQSCPAPPKPDGPAFCTTDKKSTSFHSTPRPLHKYNRQHSPDGIEYNSEDPGHRQQHHQRKYDDDYNQEDSVVGLRSSTHMAQRYPADDSEDYDESIYKPTGPHTCIQETTEYIRSPTDICFTTRPVHECTEACKPKGSKKVRYGFHCLPRDRSYVRDLMAQADEGLVQQVLHKSSDRYDYVTVPEICVPRF